MRGLRILVLGGAGFIGSEAVKNLVKTSDFSETVIGDIDLEKAKFHSRVKRWKSFSHKGRCTQ